MELEPWRRQEDEFNSDSGASHYYSTGGCYRPPKRTRNNGWIFAVAGMIMLLIVGTGVARNYITRTSVTDYEGNDQFTMSEEHFLASDASHVTNQSAQTGNDNRELTTNNEEQESSSDCSSFVIESVAGNELSLQEIYKKVIPSVVSITADSTNGTSYGTGIIMSTDGYIITNYHVISSASSIDILLENGDLYSAKIIGSDEISDLSVLKIDAADLTPAEFGNSDSVEVGDSVVAIGDPLGVELRGTMTDGIICGISRDIIVDGRNMTLIQTNAALNSGNSGGPLVNMYGQVIGINTMKYSTYASTSVEGIGFAIPIASAKKVIDELTTLGYVEGRPATGITLKTVDVRLMYYYRLPGVVCVAAVDEDSDAYAKGISPGDIILSVDDCDVSSLDEFHDIINGHNAGDVVTLTIYSNGTLEQVSIQLMDASEMSS